MSKFANKHRKALAAVASVSAAMLVLAGGVWGYDYAQRDQIAPGVRVAGVEIGAQGVDQAREVLRRRVVAPLSEPVQVNFEGNTYNLTSEQLGQHADLEGMLEDAVAASREGGLVTRVGRYVKGSAVNVELPAQVTYSSAAIDDFVAKLARKIERDPENAKLVPGGDSLTPKAGRDGVELLTGAIREMIVAQVQSPTAGRTVEAPVRTTEPEITKSELAEVYPTYVTVDRANFTLRLFKNLKLKKKYKVAVGQIGLETPAGLYHIVDKQIDPTWNVPNSAWAGDLAGRSIPPGPSNPLKARWMGIYDGAGIHGTDNIASLGSAASHGCVRMAIPDVTDLYDRVPLGTPIYVS